MYRTLVQYAGVDAALAQAWWTALEHARWSVPRTWKLDVVFFSQHHRSRTAELDGVLPFLRRRAPQAAWYRSWRPWCRSGSWRAGGVRD